jgi:5,10-methylenetetrahydromethanopterin reductase
MSVNLGLLAASTSHIRFGVVVTNPVTRHPAVMASTFASVHLLSGERSWMGIGTGNNAVRNLGLRAARLAELEEFIHCFRQLIAVGRATYQGSECALPWPRAALSSPVPVLIAANGPRSLHLAGRVADGVIAGGGITPAAIDQQLTYIEQGARTAGRSMEDIDVWFQVVVSIADTHEQAITPAIDLLAAIGSRNFRSTFEGKQVPGTLESAIREFESAYRYAEHATSAGHNAELLTRFGLTEFFASLWLLGGTPIETLEQLRALKAHGATNIHVLPVGDRALVTEVFATSIIPQLAST